MGVQSAGPRRPRRLPPARHGGRAARPASADQPALRVQLAGRDRELRADRSGAARELLLEFADFTRYAFRRGGEFTTLADELRNVERYLVLEQARFGDRLHVELVVAPEVLPVAVPFLAVQPLVENAVRHGLEGKPGAGRVTLVAQDAGSEALISVEDDGVGSEPDLVRRVLAGETDADSVGLGNVDARLRQVFGDSYGLVVETAPGAGTKVSFRVPKFAPGVRVG
jgi:two-component system LytT family sensor kinase